MSQDMTVEDEDTEAMEEALKPQNIIDTVHFGRRLRALRVLNGFDRVTEFTALLRSKFGIEVSDRTVYAIERGEQMPHLDFFVACLATFDQPYDYFWPAIRRDVVEQIQNRAQR